jgi:hypothetical protein
MMAYFAMEDLGQLDSLVDQVLTADSLSDLDLG